MKPVCARAGSQYGGGLIGGQGNAGMRPERRIKLGVDGGKPVASKFEFHTLDRSRLISMAARPSTRLMCFPFSTTTVALWN
jgi:hypothetical protein